MELTLSEFDIVNEIKTRFFLGEKLGEKISPKIIAAFSKLPDDSTLRIDITGADASEYKFYRTAIGPLFKSLCDGEFNKKYLIIKLDYEQVPLLLEGILWYIFPEKPSKEDPKSSFVKNNLSIKLFYSQDEKLEFCGPLEEMEKKILNLINEQKKLTANGVAKNLGISVEEAIKQLKKLEGKFFIYTEKPEKGRDDSYCSFYNFLNIPFTV